MTGALNQTTTTKIGSVAASNKTHPISLWKKSSIETPAQLICPRGPFVGVIPKLLKMKKRWMKQAKKFPKADALTQINRLLTSSAQCGCIP